ncbi:uncharacterized protein L201_000239 [Kwoniella dendrophila CBS 6074]|uniref:Thioredoxin domain-containing protein n=1 Tax=Kwoniella dendrophila CBS 6074 TaxID=1295534 RepID=A0AAX4JIU6_9TREE
MVSESSTPLTSEELDQAYQAEILDKDGKKQTLGDLIKGKRVVLIFIRHFWCTNCQAYTYQFGRSIPPSSLPEGTVVYVIGCGTSKPISAYVERTQSPYPIYADPSLELYKIFKFSRTLKGANKNEKKDYMSQLGKGYLGAFNTITNGLFNNPSHSMESVRGPNDQNGGELIIEKDGTCFYINRMQNTEDHTDLKELSGLIGARYVALSDKEKSFPN